MEKWVSILLFKYICTYHCKIWSLMLSLLTHATSCNVCYLSQPDIMHLHNSYWKGCEVERVTPKPTLARKHQIWGCIILPLLFECWILTLLFHFSVSWAPNLATNFIGIWLTCINCLAMIWPGAAMSGPWPFAGNCHRLAHFRDTYWQVRISDTSAYHILVSDWISNIKFSWFVDYTTLHILGITINPTLAFSLSLSLSLSLPQRDQPSCSDWGRPTWKGWGTGHRPWPAGWVPPFRGGACHGIETCMCF